MSVSSGTLLWAGVAACWVMLLAALVVWPLRFEVSGRARGLPDGSWVVGGGVSLAVLSVALVWARGVPPQLSVLIFGRKFAFKPRQGGTRRRPLPARVTGVSRRVWARLDPLDLALKLLEERRHLRLRYLVLDVDYGFRDPLLTGRLAGALSVLSAVLPAPVELRHRPRWDLEDGWELSLDGRAIVRPWLILLDTGAHVVRHMLRASA